MTRFHFLKLPDLNGSDLLEETLLAEVYLIIPKEGRAKLFTAKIDQMDEKKVMRITQAIIEAGIDWARLYGVQVQGQIGGPPPPGAAPPS